MQERFTRQDSESILERVSVRRQHRPAVAVPPVLPLGLGPATLSVTTLDGSTEFIPLARVQRHRLHETIVSEVHALITADKLKAGDRLPPERVLAAEMGVSRNSVREALRILESRGILSARQGQGVFVASHDPDASMELPAADPRGGPTIPEMFDVRECLEREAARTAALHADEAGLAAVERALVAFECLLLGGENPLGADAEFHSALADASKNRYLAFTIKRTIHEMGGRRSVLAARADLRLLVLDQHVQVFEAVRKRRPEVAAEAIGRHLEAIRRFAEVDGPQSRETGGYSGVTHGA
jgi:GntR family transcriptional regulator, transcriptional repressor for pyruvate dehydrogenase complex